MQEKVTCCLLAIVACASAASISGLFSLDPTQFLIGKQITFPRLFGHNSPSSSNIVSYQTTTANGTNTSYYYGPPFGPFNPFLGVNPALFALLPRSGRKLPSFPDIDELISKIPDKKNNSDVEDNGNRTTSNRPFSIPFSFPAFNRSSYIPGVSEALNQARQHLAAALKISTDLNTGIRDAIQTALDSDRPADSIRIMLGTIAQVYSTVAASCPLISVGSRVFGEGIRLAGEVVRSIGNVAAGSSFEVVMR